MRQHSAFIAAFVLAAGSLLAQTASAQYVWTDEKGTRQYSDTPPPPSVPPSRIIKAPAAAPGKPANGNALANVDKPTASAPAAGSGEDIRKTPSSVAEKNAEFNRRKMEREEQEKKAAEQSRIAAEKMKNCERAKEYRRLLDSGQRIATVDANGERTVLTDDRRAAEAAETNQILKDCR